MKKILVVLMLLTQGVAQAPHVGPGATVFPIGPRHREIAETSPVAKVVIERTAPARGMKQFKVAVRATLYNTTDHELSFVNPEQYYDVLDNKTGKRAANTPAGCYGNFFMDCYTPSIPAGVGYGYGGVPPTYVIPPHGSKVIEPALQYLDMDYTLDPGEYTVVGYFCSTERDKPECFKSNKITILL